MTAETLSEDVRVAALAVIRAAILEHPRSLQTSIGASELGGPCVRKLGHKLAGTPSPRAARVSWRPTVGTAVHAWLERAMIAENAKLGWARWQVELEVVVGTVGGRPITGHLDVYDVLTGTVLDWKIVGKTTLDKVRRTGDPGPQYRGQVQLYARGVAADRWDPERVAIFYLPASGELDQGYFWSAPYDESAALAVLARADALATLGALKGWPGTLPSLPTAEDFCTHCPWWQPGATDLTVACPGIAVEIPTGPAFGAIGGRREIG